MARSSLQLNLATSTSRPNQAEVVNETTETTINWANLRPSGPGAAETGSDDNNQSQGGDQCK